MNGETNKFKIILLSAFGFFIFLGLIAFSTYKSSNSGTTQTAITIWGTVDQTTFDNFISKYKQDQSVDFNLTYVQYPIDTIDSQLVEAIATGKGPDAILIPQELEKRYLDKVYFIPETSLPLRTFQDTYIDEANLYAQPDGIFAVPFFVDPLVMYWNKDTFSSAAIATPPKSWSDFPLLASKLSKSDSSANITQSAVALGEYTNVDNAKALLSTLIMQAGSPIVSSDATGVLASALYSQTSGQVEIPAISALNFFTDYSNPQKSIYSWNKSLPDSKSFFLSGNLATYFGFASEAADIAEKNPNLNFDVALMPQTVDTTAKITFGELYGFAVLKSSPNVVPAFNMISTLTSGSAVADFLQFDNVAPARRDLIMAGNTDPQKTVFYDSALIARGWIDPDAAQTDQIFQTMVEDVSTGRLDADTSVQKASTELDNLLQ
jgi:ABC-type glycerol-3-phosphate transport system substrate-binding protein